MVLVAWVSLEAQASGVWSSSWHSPSSIHFHFRFGMLQQLLTTSLCPFVVMLIPGKCLQLIILRYFAVNHYILWLIIFLTESTEYLHRLHRYYVHNFINQTIGLFHCPATLEEFEAGLKLDSSPLDIMNFRN